MLRHRGFFAALAVLGLSALAAPRLRAQTGYVGSGPVSGYTSGSQIDRRPVVPVTAYPATTLYLPGYRGTMWSPIFMTSLNYPGVYGSYTLSGVANNSLFYREPMVYPRDNSSVVSAVSTTVVPPAPSVNVMRSTTLSTPASGTATIRVRLPADARLYFEGELTTSTGPDRVFQSPALALGRNYRYDVKAVWNDNGQEVVRQRSVLVRAGREVDVDLTGPGALEEQPTLKTRPLPPPARAIDPGLPPSQSLSPRTPRIDPGRPSNPPTPTPESNRRDALERAPGRSPGP
jgi:uncharacterized protein (TIGR03000 family)